MMALADASLYAAILANIGPVALAVTTNLAFNFLRKPDRADLIGECRLFKRGKSLAVGEVAIRTDWGAQSIRVPTDLL
jgi:acyl-coenzyme A thioesterase PaaI-like protein